MTSRQCAQRRADRRRRDACAIHVEGCRRSASTKARWRSRARTKGHRRSGDRSNSGWRGIRTPCCFPRVLRSDVKAAQKAAHRPGGAGGEVGAHGGHRARGRRDVGRAGRGRGHTGQRGGFPGEWREASGWASWAATGPPSRERMLLARRRSWRGRSSLFQEGVTGFTGTGTGAPSHVASTHAKSARQSAQALLQSPWVRFSDSATNN